MSPHRCPIEGCDESVPRNLLMCRPHWLLVPRELQREVWRTHRAVERQWTQQRADEHALAVNAAVSAVEEVAA